MAASNAEILGSSQDPKELFGAACELARSRQASDQVALRKHLMSEAFLYRLDSPEDYENTGQRLRIQGVLEALSKNPTASQETLLALTQDKVFLSAVERVDPLIEATEVIRPAPPELVGFWSRHCQPTDSFKHLTIETLVENRSDPALKLLEQRMADPKFKEEDKVGWMRGSILTHRYNRAVLQSCERMLRGDLPDPLRPTLVEAIFDHKIEWYTPHGVNHPPKLSEARGPVRTQLRRLGQYALQEVPLLPGQRRAVEETLTSL